MPPFRRRGDSLLRLRSSLSLSFGSTHAGTMTCTDAAVHTGLPSKDHHPVQNSNARSSRLSPRTHGTSSNTPNARDDARASRAPTTAAAAVTSNTAPKSTSQLLALNHFQRMLRRLPVGRSSALFHVNEMPPNLQGLAFRSAQEHLREGDVSETAPAPGGDPQGDASPPSDNAPAMKASAAQLLSLHEPLLSPHDGNLIAGYRRALRERRRVRTAQKRRWFQRQQLRQGSDAAAAAEGAMLDAFDYLEEPCLLLPDTKRTFASLGFTAAGATASAASSSYSSATEESSPLSTSAPAQDFARTETAHLDSVFLGLTTNNSDYRVDYHALPSMYVLGVPSALLPALHPSAEEQHRTAFDGGKLGDHERRRRPAPRRAAVDLSRWVVYDPSTTQFLLRRRHSTKVSDGDTTESKCHASGYIDLLESQVFLAQTYVLDPRRAYAAAAAASVPSCGFTLFFFHHARGKDGASQASADQLGVLYPTCFHSYMSQLPSLAHLVAEVEGGEGAMTCMEDRADAPGSLFMDAPVPAASAAPHLVVPQSTKRLRFTAISDGATHAWATQHELQRRPPPPSHAGTFAMKPSADRRNGGSGTAGNEEITDRLERESLTETRDLITQAFQEWRASVWAQMPPKSLNRDVAEGKGSDVFTEEEDAGFSTHVRRSGTETVGLASRLDAESVALLRGGGATEAWRSGWRMAATPIAVAMAVVYEPDMSLYATLHPTGFSVPPSRDGKGNTVPSGGGGTAVSDDAAGLVGALWQALYLAPDTAMSDTHPSHIGGGAVLPLAEDRLAFARQRVLLPFLRAPRRLSRQELLSDPFTTAPPVLSTGSTDGSARLPVRRATHKSEEEPSCPLLWQAGEVGAACGWLRLNTHFRDVFGDFARLLPHELYVSLGRRTPALPPVHRCDQGRCAVVDSPVLLLKDATYVQHRLLPALGAFAAATTTLRLCTDLCRSGSEGGQRQGLLYHYHGLSELDMTSRKTAYMNNAAESSSTDASEVSLNPHLMHTSASNVSTDLLTSETAVAIAVHHQLLRLYLRQVQKTPAGQLQQWLLARASAESQVTADLSQNTGVPVLLLRWLKGWLARQVPSGEEAGAEVAVYADKKSVFAHRLSALQSLKAVDIEVVPLLDFVSWAALSSDFTDASCGRVRASFNAARASFDGRDQLMAVKYCLQYPDLLCVEGGDGGTVAVLHEGQSGR